MEASEQTQTTPEPGTEKHGRAPESDAKPKKLTPYVVLMEQSFPQQEGPPLTALVPVADVTAGGQREAKMEAAKEDAVMDALADGEVTLVAVPKTSWNPTKVKLERTESLRLA
jgi:hypothetical protein